jgi:hypothetical protein
MSESQETTEPALDPSASTIGSSFTLQGVHDVALKQLEHIGCPSPADYQRVEGATRLQDFLDSTVFRDANARLSSRVLKNFLVVSVVALPFLYLSKV